LGLLIDLRGQRIGVSCTNGQMVAQGGVGVAWSADLRPTPQSTRHLISPGMPFESEDLYWGCRCINLALADIREP
jgi:hypothetical protein